MQPRHPTRRYNNLCAQALHIPLKASRLCRCTARFELAAMKNSQNKTLTADLGLLYTAAIWGSTFVMVKDSLDFVHPVILIAYRFFLAAFIMGAFLVYRSRPLFSNFKSGLVLGVLVWLAYAAQTIGLATTSAANSGFITGLFIVFVPLLDLLFFRRKPGKSQMVSILVAAVGVWFLTGGPSKINRGDMITFITSVSYAAHILYADRLVSQKMNPHTINFQQFLVTGVLSLLVGLAWRLPWTVSAPQAVGAIIFLALFPTISAFAIMLWAQQITGPMKVSLFFSLEPVFAALFAWTVGGETFIPAQAFGGFLIFAAILLFNLSTSKNGQPAKTRVRSEKVI